MKVAYPMRVDALAKPGGDVLLMKRYISECQNLCGARGSAFVGKVLTEIEPDFTDYDVVHLSNLDRPFDLYMQFLSAKRAGKRTVLTPLHHSYEEIEQYEKHGRGGLIGLVSGMLGFYHLETLRTFLRSRRYPELRRALNVTLSKGLRAAQIEVLQGVDLILVAADKELVDIEREICALDRSRVKCVRNGFQMPTTKPLPHGERDIMILVAGRLEARKNQIAILKALDGLGLAAIFVGTDNPNHKGYCRQFRRLLSTSKSRLIDGVSVEELYKLLARSRVHVAASWFEVSSLLDVEAFVLGCRTVASLRGGTRELLGAGAIYVDPGSLASIREGIQLALDVSDSAVTNSLDLEGGLLATWEQIAEQICAIYEPAVQYPAIG